MKMPPAGAAPVDQGHRRPVGLEPLVVCVLRLAPVLAAWAVLLAGRPVCLLAQRVPPLVLLVRMCRRWLARRDGTPC